MRPGTIIGLATGVLLLGATGAGLWYWNNQNASGIAQPTAAATGAAESDTGLARRVQSLHDSLQGIDVQLRQAQVSDSELPSDLVQKQAGLWERYTWARTRLSDAVDASQQVAAAAPVGGASPAPVPTPRRTSDLGAMLGHLATYLWVLAGLGAFAVAVLAWLLLFRRPTVPTGLRPLTEPTVRQDRNVRMPVARAEPPGPPVREATFTQMRQAREPAHEYDEMPAAPLPRTGRHAWENTVSQPQPQMAPSEPTAVQDYVVSMAKRGRTPAEIARRLRIPQDQVDLILKLRRNS